MTEKDDNKGQHLIEAAQYLKAINNGKPPPNISREFAASTLKEIFAIYKKHGKLDEAVSLAKLTWKNARKIWSERASDYARSLPDFLLMEEDLVPKKELLSDEYEDPTSMKNRLKYKLHLKDEHVIPPESDIELIEARKASSYSQPAAVAGTLDKV